MPNFIATLKTDKDVSFIGAIAQNAVEYADVALPSALSGVGGRARMRLTQVSIIATESLDYELLLFSGVAHATSDPDTNTFLGLVSFTAAASKRIAAAGLYYYYVSGLDLPYNDDDATGKLHVGLVNRSAASKTAGAGGAMAVSFTFTELGP